MYGIDCQVCTFDTWLTEPPRPGMHFCPPDTGVTADDQPSRIKTDVDEQARPFKVLNRAKKAATTQGTQPRVKVGLLSLMRSALSRMLH